MIDQKQRIAILRKNMQRWLDHNKTLTNDSGIYVLERTDENGFHYAYVGQSVHVLTRLAEHLSASAGVFTSDTQWIDYSLRKHGIYSKDNKHGWKAMQFCYCREALNEAERSTIKAYADAGYQLRNKTIGGQDGDKASLDGGAVRKGYREGVAKGYEKARKEVAKLFEKNLTAEINGKETANKRKALEKFKTFIGGKNE